VHELCDFLVAVTLPRNLFNDVILLFIPMSVRDSARVILSLLGKLKGLPILVFEKGEQAALPIRSVFALGLSTRLLISPPISSPLVVEPSLCLLMRANKDEPQDLFGPLAN
jgi:hypothetical protein